jgi:hypothetical protein
MQVNLTAVGARVFRNNTAVAWAGKVVKVFQPTKLILMPGDVVIRQAYPIHAGLCEGSSDLIGISPPSGRFVAVEAKSGSGRLTKSQSNFINFILESGGIAFKATSPEEAVIEYQRQL